MKTNVEGYKIRKWFEFFEESASNEMGVETEGEPIAKFVVGVVIQNPYASKFSQDLSLLTEPSFRLGDALQTMVSEISIVSGNISLSWITGGSVDNSSSQNKRKKVLNRKKSKLKKSKAKRL